MELLLFGRKCFRYVQPGGVPQGDFLVPPQLVPEGKNEEVTLYLFKKQKKTTATKTSYIVVKLAIAL